MIQFISPKNSVEKRKWVLELDPREITYIVPDLATKSEVQRHFFKEKNIPILEEDSVLRANEFWLKGITQNFFDFQMISSFLAQTLLQQWVGESEVQISTSGVKRLQGYFQQLLPIITKPSSVDIVHEWFQENPDSFISWGRWYQLSVMAWDKFNQNGLIPQSSLSAYIVANIESFQLQWNRHIYFDLGADLNLTEVEIIHFLSSNHDITVVMPDPSLTSKYESLFASYKLLREKQGLLPEVKLGEEFIDSENFREVVKSFKRFSTVVSEVKDLTAQVRAWLGAGVSQEDIAVITPNIEQYWPIIKPYFDREGIAIHKHEIIIASTLPAVARWISNLRIFSGQLSSVDIEVLEFSKENLQIEFEDFKKLYSVFYDESDLKRGDDLYKKYYQKIDKDKSYLRDDFLIWSLSFWQSTDEHDTLKVVFNQILLECPQYTTMQLRHWLAYLEQICSKKEITIEKSDHGVNCSNLSASSWLQSQYVYLVGLSTTQFKTNPVDSIDLGEISKLYQQTGFLVDKFNVSNENYLLSWMSRKKLKEIIYSYPETGINGEVGAPVLFWLEEKYKQDQETHTKNIPQSSFWDRLQQRKKAQLSDEDAIEFVVQLDIGQGQYRNLAKREYTKKLTFSPTSIERYLSCPFIYLSEKLYNLRDFPDIDFDENPMNRGRISHAIVEKLTEEPFRAVVSDGELISVIETCKKELDLEYYNDEIWYYHRAKYLKLAKKFLEAEQSYRLQFPQMRTAHREKKIKLLWSPVEKGFSNQGFPLNLVIDRIDENQNGDYVIVDYKSSAAQASNHESWLKNKNLQMPLYSMAYRQWLSNGSSQRQFAGAFYYVLKDMSRFKGLKVASHDQSLFELGSKRSQIDNEGLEQLEESMSEIISQTIKNVEAGYFEPKPDDINKCGQCNWRSVCRAPHLN